MNPHDSNTKPDTDTDTSEEADESPSLDYDVPPAQTPVSFPLPPLASEVAAAMRKEWGRSDLPLYLRRWKDASLPPVPSALWDFAWRACDIGCGQGRFLLTESALHPDRGYLGIDKGSRRSAIMQRRFADTQQANLFPLHGHAVPLLAAMPPASFDLVTLFYQNPWWPTKHRKKRWAWHPIFPSMIHLLRPGGEIVYTSNEAFSLQEWLYALNAHPLLTDLLEPLYIGPIQEMQGRTHFERKFLSVRMPCGEIRFRRKPETNGGSPCVLPSPLLGSS